MNKGISIDALISHGQACFTGTRIQVYQIVRMIRNGDTIDDLVREYPSLSRASISAGLNYEASLAEGHAVLC